MLVEILGVVAGLLVVAQAAPVTPAATALWLLPPDCAQLLSVETPAPGIAILCEAEDAMRRAAHPSADPADRLAQWRSAAAAYQRATALLRSVKRKIYVHEMLVRVHGASRLDEPRAVEESLRALATVDVGTPAPLMRLAKFQEDQKQFDAAEQTLLGTRQQHADSLDLLREMSQFFARRVVALTGGANKPADGDSAPAAAAAETKYKPDCGQTTFNAPGPQGLAGLCRAEALMRDAAASKEADESRERWTAAAESYERAATALRDVESKRYAYDALARLNGSRSLNNPRAAEAAVLELVALDPTGVEPVIQLASVREEMKQIDLAESTLVGARQRFPDEVEVLRALSRFYARLAAARSAIDSRADRDSERPPAPGQPDENGYYPIGAHVPPPKPIEKRLASYPEEARAVGLEGVVILELWVDDTGRVEKVRMLRGIPMLEDAALDAAKQWRYEPAVVDGRRVPVRMIVTHNFTVTRDPR